MNALLESDPQVRREVEIAASPEEVWEALTTDEGRAAWLEPEPDRELQLERADAPTHLVWWWWRPGEPPRRVDIRVVAIPAGARVIVTETAPEFPLARLAAALACALA